MSKKSLFYFAALPALVMSWAAPAANEGEDYQARSWAASCAACHGTNGRSEGREGKIPALAGKSKADLLHALMDFKGDRKKAATVMHQHAKGYTDEQLDRLAEYFSKQPR